MFNQVYYGKKTPKPMNPKILLWIIVGVFLYTCSSQKQSGITNEAPLSACANGPINNVKQCMKKESPANSTTQWQYTLAIGLPSDKTCEMMSQNEAVIKFLPDDHQPETSVQKLKCDVLGFSEHTHFCYASHMLDDNKDHHVEVVIVDANCSQAYYLQGKNAMLVKGQPMPLPDTSSIYGNLPTLQK